MQRYLHDLSAARVPEVCELKKLGVLLGRKQAHVANRLAFMMQAVLEKLVRLILDKLHTCTEPAAAASGVTGPASPLDSH